jgi:hypothetical protein
VAVAVLTLLGFVAVMAAVEFLTARGQWAFGRVYMGLSGPETIASYVAIQGLMLATAALSMWAVLSGDRYFTHRVWTGIFLAASATASYLGAEAAGWPTIGALFVAGFAFAALRTWHAILHRIARGTAPRYPVMGYPVMRWALAREETKAAYKLMVLERLSPDAALAAVRGKFAPVIESRDGGAPVDLSKVSKAQAVRMAFAELGSYEVTPALEWLAAHQVTVDRSYVYDLARKEQAARRSEMRALPGTAPARKATSAKPEITVRQVS